ncbi:hypothetical protein CR513_47813, partial [Mucuna pruriens]
MCGVQIKKNQYTGLSKLLANGIGSLMILSFPLDLRKTLLTISGSKIIFLILYIDDILLATNDLGLFHETKKFFFRNFEMEDMSEASYACLKKHISIKYKRNSRWKSAQHHPFQFRKKINLVSHNVLKMIWNKNKWKQFRMHKLLGVSCMLKEQRNTCLHIGGLITLRCSDIHTQTLDTRKPTLGYVFLLVKGAISWKRAKQSIVAASIMEVEFVACFEATIQANWFQNFISRLGIVNNIVKSLKMYYDNSVVNDKYSKGVKHLELKYFVVKEEVVT